jgi:16S rRNA (adenine1518-N6/adenine1519-N6)-dimethyltransferase
MAKARLGQHFLKNPSVVTKITAALDIQQGETIFEVGPGHGELTISLREPCRNKGAKLIVVERDEALATALESRLAEEKTGDSVTVVRGDILEEAKTGLFSRLAGETHYKIVGNIPYYLTGHLLRIVGDLERKPERAVFMIQKEVAERATAQAPDMNRLSASIQYWSTPKIIARVPKSDFSPPPEVDSAIIVLETKNPQPKNAEAYYQAVHAIFAQPRKMVINNLMDRESREGPYDTKEKILELLAELHIDAKARPQNLTVAMVSNLADRIFSNS